MVLDDKNKVKFHINQIKILKIFYYYYYYNKNHKHYLIHLLMNFQFQSEDYFLIILLYIF